jgi:hypothetical protein
MHASSEVQSVVPGGISAFSAISANGFRLDGRPLDADALAQKWLWGVLKGYSSPF